MTVNYAKDRSALPNSDGRTTPGLSGVGLAVLLISAAMTMIDFFIVNVALESIRADLHADPASLEWVVAGYGGAYAAFLVMGGRLGDAIGRRRTAVIGLVAFTATSAVCGLAPNVGVLISARVFQGVSAALLLPQTLATIRATTHGETQSRAIGLTTTPAGGQGMNTGFMDVFNLCWRLAMVVRGVQPENLLDAYSDERHRACEQVLAGTEGQIRQGSAQTEAEVAGRREQFRGLASRIGEQRVLVRRLAQLSISYGTGDADSIVGDRLPVIPRTEPCADGFLFVSPFEYTIINWMGHRPKSGEVGVFVDRVVRA